MEPILPAEKEVMEKGRQGGTRKGDTRRSVELMRLMDERLRKEVVYRSPLLIGCSACTAVEHCADRIHCPQMSSSTG